jgi:hypothetical protein
MAAPFPTTYYLGIGTAISNVGVMTELSGGSYARLACGFTGTAVSGLTQTVGPWVVATAPSPAVNCYYGMIFDALTGGNFIAYWTWSPTVSGYTGSLTAFPSTTINIVFNTYIMTALNLALQGGQGTSGSLLDAGAQIGTANGNPMLSGCRLGIGAGGTLIAHQGIGQWVSSMDVQNIMYSNAFASGNIANGLASNSAGTQAAGTVMTGFLNVITTNTAGYSVTLPGPTLNPGAVGTWLTIINTTTAQMNCYPDLGSSINGLSTNAVYSFITAAARSVTFYRASSTNWYTVPFAAS